LSTIKQSHISQLNQPVGTAGARKSKEKKHTAPVDSVDISSKKTETEKDWTVLVYMNDNNNLSWQGNAKLNCQLKEIDKSDKMNIAVHFSALRSKGWNHPNAINSTRYEVRKNGVRKMEELGPLNMASPDTLVDFVKWGMNKYPAKHYMIVVQGHGGAWHGGLPDDVYDDRMDLPKMDEAFTRIKKETGTVPDVIAFYSCLMANTEAAYQFRDHAKIMIGSEEVEFGAQSQYAEDVSAPYKDIFNGLSQKLDSGADVGPEALAKDWVKACDGKWTTPTQSAIDLTKMESFAKSLDRLATCILKGETPIEVIRDIANNTKHMRHKEIDRWYQNDDHTYNLRDLRELAENLSKDPRIKDKDTVEASRAVLKQFDEVVIANEAGTDYDTYSPVRYSEPHHITDHYEGHRNHGLSIFAPTNPKIMAYLEKAEKYPTKYREIAFARETAWGELVSKLSAE